VPPINRAEVWLTDTLVPHTTSVRNTRFEVFVPKPFLKSGAFDAQGLVTVAPPRLIRKLGKLEAAELELISRAVKRWLGLAEQH
jgi:mRNA interferase MazF